MTSYTLHDGAVLEHRFQQAALFLTGVLHLVDQDEREPGAQAGGQAGVLVQVPGGDRVHVGVAEDTA